MSALIGMSRAAWKRQPNHPVRVNWNHPLAANLEEYTLATPCGLLTAGGTISQSLGTVPPTNFCGPFGFGIRTFATWNPQYTVASLTRLITISAVTLYARVLLPTNISGSSVRWVYRIDVNPSTSNYIGLAVNALNFTGNNKINGAERLTGAITVQAMRQYDVFLSHPGDTSEATLEVFGVGTANSLSSNLSYTAGNASVQTGHNANTGAPGDKVFFVGGLWGRVLSPAERSALADNPYQLFVPKQSRFYLIPTAAATAPGVPTSLLNQNLAATSFRSAWTAPA
jgi:hypothetical protein